MKNSNQFLSTTVSYLIFAISVIVLGIITYSNLHKGLVFNDEAYYLFHYKNAGQMLSFDRTNFYRIFRFLYSPNIYHFRIISITTLVLSNFLLFYSVLKYIGFKGNLFFYSLLGIISGFLSWEMIDCVIHQYIGNTILVNVGLSLWLFSSVFRANFLKIISGFVLSFLLFDGNSHSLTLIPLFIFFMVSDKKKWLTNALLFTAGFVSGIVIYFTFMDSLSNFKYQITFLKEYLGFHKKQHSKRFMVMWVVYLFANGILPMILTYLVLRASNFSKKAMTIFEHVIGFIGILTLLSMFFFSTYFIWLLILLAHLMVLRFWFNQEETLRTKYLITLLLIIPYGLCFGSQTFFIYRLNAYLVYYTLLFFIIIFRNYSFNWKLSFIFLVSIFVVRFLDYNKERGWKDFVFKEQTEPVLVNSHYLYLDKGRKKDLDDLRPYLKNQPRVIYSSNHLLGYLYILDAYPPIPYYFTLKDYLKFIIKKSGRTPDDYIYVESNDYPFSPKEFLPLQFVDHPESFKVVKAGRFTVYLPPSFQRK